MTRVVPRDTPAAPRRFLVSWSHSRNDGRTAPGFGSDLCEAERLDVAAIRSWALQIARVTRCPLDGIAILGVVELEPDR